MKKLGLLVMPLMTLSLLASCNKGGGDKPEQVEFMLSSDQPTIVEEKTATVYVDWKPTDHTIKFDSFTFTADPLKQNTVTFELTGNPRPMPVTITFKNYITEDINGTLSFSYEDVTAKTKGESSLEVAIDAPEPGETCTITWVNYDDEVLEIDENVKKGRMPHFDGETPTRPDDEMYHYTFNEWSPSLEEVTESTTYKATYVNEETPTTTIKISIPESNNAEYPFEFWYESEGDIKVDWGDGTTIDSSKNTHTYTSPGNYVIKIDNITNLTLSDDEFLLPGTGYVTNVYLGNLSTSTGNFCDCPLTSITIPSTVVSIGGYTFLGCDKLETVMFLDGSKLNSINDSAFRGCHSLTSITIPSTVTSISGYAFRYCYSLTEVNLTNFTVEDNIPICGGDAFDECSTDLMFEVASEEMANKFKDSNKGWPNTLDKYHWPGKPSSLN